MDDYYKSVPPCEPTMTYSDMLTILYCELFRKHLPIWKTGDKGCWDFSVAEVSMYCELGLQDKCNYQLGII